MNRGGLESPHLPAAVVVKGDLTANGTVDEYEQFLALRAVARAVPAPRAGQPRLYHGGTYAATPTQLVEVPDARDPRHLDPAQRDRSGPRRSWRGSPTSRRTPKRWPPGAALRAPPPVDPGSPKRARLLRHNPDDSERLVDVVAAHRSIIGYFEPPIATVRHWRRAICPGSKSRVKDFRARAEYRVRRWGAQVVHRIAAPRRCGPVDA
jgi:hypothetical protein